MLQAFPESWDELGLESKRLEASRNHTLGPTFHGRKGSLQDSVADRKGEMPAGAHSLGGGGAVGKRPRAPLKGAHSMMG